MNTPIRKRTVIALCVVCRREVKRVTDVADAVLVDALEKAITKYHICPVNEHNLIIENRPIGNFYFIWKEQGKKEIEVSHSLDCRDKYALYTAARLRLEAARDACPLCKQKVRDKDRKPA